jgi:hypothetical protein
MGRITAEGGITPSFGDFYPLLVPESRESGRPPPSRQTYIYLRRKMNPRTVLIEACKRKASTRTTTFCDCVLLPLPVAGAFLRPHSREVVG